MCGGGGGEGREGMGRKCWINFDVDVISILKTMLPRCGSADLFHM